MTSRSNPFKLYELYVLLAPLPADTLVQVQNMKKNSEKALRNLSKIPGNAIGVEVISVDGIMNRNYKKLNSEDETRHTEKTRQLIEHMKNEFQKLHFPALVCKKTNRIYVLNDIVDVLREVDFVSEFVKILSEKMSQICDVTTSMLEMQQQQQQQQQSNRPNYYRPTETDGFDPEVEFENAYADVDQYLPRPIIAYSTQQPPSRLFRQQPPQPVQQKQTPPQYNRFHLNYAGGSARAPTQTPTQPTTTVPEAPVKATQPSTTAVPPAVPVPVAAVSTTSSPPAVTNPVPAAEQPVSAARQREIDELKRFASTLTSQSRRPSTTSLQKPTNIIPAMDLLSSHHNATVPTPAPSALPIAKSSDDIFALFQIQNIPLVPDKTAPK